MRERIIKGVKLCGIRTDVGVETDSGRVYIGNRTVSEGNKHWFPTSTLTPEAAKVLVGVLRQAIEDVG